MNEEIENLQDKIHSFANDDNYKEDYSLFRIGDVEKALDEIRYLYFKIEKYQQKNARLKDKIEKVIEYVNHYETIRGYYEYEECGYDEYNYEEDLKEELLELLKEN